MFFRMCDILHARHVKIYLRFDALFNMSSVKKKQEKLLAIIHGLTKRVYAFFLFVPVEFFY